MRKTLGGTATEFLHDGNNPVQEITGAGPANLLIGLGIDGYFSRTDTSGTSSTFLTDALGSTLALTDPTGTVETQYTYAPFGQTTTTGAPSTNPFGWTGRELDGTGLQFLRARYYSPTLHRFIGEDPIGSLGGDPNFYVYVRNNPTKFIDPTGLLFERIWSSPQQRGAHTSQAITMSQFIEYAKGKTLSQIQHDLDQRVGRVAGESSAGGPLPEYRYVINPSNPSEVIDMRHFLVIGPKGEIFGLGVEIAQLFTDPGSAFDAQDFLSNYLGRECFRGYDPQRPLADQLAEFFRLSQQLGGRKR